MSNVEHLFMCLLAICMSSLEKCLSRSFSHLWLGCLFFWYWFAWATCIFWILIIFQLFHLLLFFSHSEYCLFTLFIVSFAVQKLLNLIRSHLLIFYFHYSRRYVIEDLSVIYVIECSAFVFFSEFYGFWSYIKSLIHFEFIFVYGVRKYSNVILLCVTVQFPAPLIEEIAFSPLYILASFAKDKVSIGMLVYL